MPKWNVARSCSSWRSAAAGLEVGHAGKPGVGKERGRERQHAAHVAERQRAPPDVVARQPIALDHRGRCADDGLVTEPAPLRVGARAGGVHQESVVANRDRGGRVVDRLLGHSGARLGRRRTGSRKPGALVSPSRTHARSDGVAGSASAAGSSASERPGSATASSAAKSTRSAIRSVRQDHPERGVGGDVGELLGAIPRVDQHGHGAEKGGAEERD